MSEEVLENVETINNAFENEDESVLTETSQIEQISVEDQQKSIIPIDYNSYSGIVLDNNVNSELYTISLVEDDGDILETYSVPTDISKYISVIDGQIYNFSSSTVQLTAFTDYGFYYRMLEIPPYGSEEYYKLIAETSIPYRMECAIDDGEYLTSVPSWSYGCHFESNSQLYAWDLTTIFLFIIMIILIVKNLFRKG